MIASETYVLAADIGGTNARLALAEVSAGQPDLLYAQDFRCRDFPSLRAVVGEFLSGAGRVSARMRPQAAAFAVAGPVGPAGADLPNAPWNVRLDELDDLGLGPVRLLNDFEALAIGVAALGEHDTPPIGPALNGVAGAPRIVVGAGTGFGLAAMLGGGDAPAQVIAGEGGHASFAPTDDTEIEILRRFRRWYGRVSIERLVSGPGLRILYLTLGQISGVYADPDLTPEDIATLGMRGRDDLCAQTLARFCAIFGSVAGDAALTFGAQGGVFIAGGLANSIAAFLEASAFRERFEAKGRLQAYVAAIPTRRVAQAHAAVLGAARFAAAALPEKARSVLTTLPETGSLRVRSVSP